MKRPYNLHCKNCIVTLQVEHKIRAKYRRTWRLRALKVRVIARGLNSSISSYCGKKIFFRSFQLFDFKQNRFNREVRHYVIANQIADSSNTLTIRKHAACRFKPTYEVERISRH